MADTLHSHNFFSQCMVDKSPVKFTNLSPSKSGQIFFNKKVGSQANLYKRQLKFCYGESQPMKVNDVFTSVPKGMFCIQGRIEWLEAERNVPVGDQLKKVRDGRFHDDTSSINISIWEPLITQIVENKQL